MRGLGRGAGGSHLTGHGEAPGRRGHGWEVGTDAPQRCRVPPLGKSPLNSLSYPALTLQELSEGTQPSQAGEQLHPMSPKSGAAPLHADHLRYGKWFQPLCPALSPPAPRMALLGGGSWPCPGTWGTAPTGSADTVLQPCAIDEGVPLVGRPGGRDALLGTGRGEEEGISPGPWPRLASPPLPSLHPSPLPLPAVKRMGAQQCLPHGDPRRTEWDEVQTQAPPCTPIHSFNKHLLMFSWARPPREIRQGPCPQGAQSRR